MLCKIHVDFATVSLERLSDKFDSIGELLIYKDLIYFKTQDTECTNQIIKKRLKAAGVKDSIVTEITVDNYQNEPEMLHTWLQEYFTAQQQAVMEDEYQEQLRQKLEQLQLALKIVTGEVQIKNKTTGGTSDGRD